MAQPEWYNIHTGQKMEAPNLSLAKATARNFVNEHINRIPQGDNCREVCASRLPSPPPSWGVHGTNISHYRTLAAELGRSAEARIDVCRDYWRYGNHAMHRAVSWWVALWPLVMGTWGEGWKVYFFQTWRGWNTSDPSQWSYPVWWDRAWDARLAEIGMTNTIPGGWWTARNNDAPPTREAWLATLPLSRREVIEKHMGWAAEPEPDPEPDPDYLLERLAEIDGRLDGIGAMLYEARVKPLPADWPPARVVAQDEYQNALDALAALADRAELLVERDYWAGEFVAGVADVLLTSFAEEPMLEEFAIGATEKLVRAWRALIYNVREDV
jgi:hypothetical protein